MRIFDDGIRYLGTENGFHVFAITGEAFTIAGTTRYLVSIVEVRA